MSRNHARAELGHPPRRRHGRQVGVDGWDRTAELRVDAGGSSE